LDNFRKYDSMRYTLIPYLYAASYEQYKTGMPLMRAMVLHYQDDENVYPISDQYMLGKDLMICPVTTKGAQTRTIYFPEGDWYDFYTGKKITGKKFLNVVAPTDHLPIYAKAGAIIPMQQSMDYVDKEKLPVMSVKVYPGNNEMEYYEDDGNSLDYQKGKFSTTTFRVKTAGKTVQFSSIPKEKGYKGALEKVQVILYSPESPKSITLNKQSFQAFKYDEKSRFIYLDIPFGSSAELTINY
jgi:alpha-glucosidase